MILPFLKIYVIIGIDKYIWLERLFRALSINRGFVPVQITHNKEFFKMKIAINILKGLEIVITAIWGIVFGIFAPLSIMYSDAAPDFADHYIVRLWLINSIVFYIVGTIIVMLKYYKVALCFHGAGLIVSLYIYSFFQGNYEGKTDQSPALLYMPIIFVTVITLIITILANYRKFTEKLEAKKEKEYQAAPSILGGKYQADKAAGRTKRKRK